MKRLASFLITFAFLIAQTSLVFALSLDPQPQKETTYTKDKVQLVFRRYEKKGAQPVILVHGLAQNCFHWDLPVAGQSFAKYLYSQGYDVWIPNLRSHGKGEFKSQTPSKSWTVDDFAVYDVPAIIEKVILTTGKKPFYIGFSMGGMVAYMYLQGIYYHPKTGRITSDLQLALERNEKLKGLITLSSPVVMAWPEKPTIQNMSSNQHYYDYNFVLDALPGRKATMYSFMFMKSVPLENVLKLLWPNETWGKSESGGWNYYLGQRFPFNYAWYAPNMSPEIMDAVLGQSVDNISGKVLAQFTQWCIKGTFSEYNVTNTKKNPYIYADNMYKVICPLYVIAGKKDKLVNHTIVYRKGFSEVSSPDKTFHSFENFGHVDICVGLQAPKIIYPSILNWMEKQMKQIKVSSQD